MKGEGIEVHNVEIIRFIKANPVSFTRKERRIRTIRAIVPQTRIGTEEKQVGSDYLPYSTIIVFL